MGAEQASRTREALVAAYLGLCGKRGPEREELFSAHEAVVWPQSRPPSQRLPMPARHFWYPKPR